MASKPSHPQETPTRRSACTPSNPDHRQKTPCACSPAGPRTARTSSPKKPPAMRTDTAPHPPAVRHCADERGGCGEGRGAEYHNRARSGGDSRGTPVTVRASGHYPSKSALRSSQHLGRCNSAMDGQFQARPRRNLSRCPLTPPHALRVALMSYASWWRRISVRCSADQAARGSMAESREAPRPVREYSTRGGTGRRPVRRHEPHQPVVHARSEGVPARVSRDPLVWGTHTLRYGHLLLRSGSPGNWARGAFQVQPSCRIRVEVPQIPAVQGELPSRWPATRQRADFAGQQGRRVASPELPKLRFRHLASTHGRD